MKRRTIMYLFFMITGFLFVTGLSILINYIYEIFSINKITKFLSPTENTIFNKIGITIIPSIIWSLIEIPMLGTNYYFLLGFILNIIISMSVIYVIKYGYNLINKNENNIVKIISIIGGTFFGFTVNYLSLLIGIQRDSKLTTSLIGILLFTVFYILIKIFPPKSNFFRETREI